MNFRVPTEQLKQLSRDQQAFEKLKELFEQVIDEQKSTEHKLQLLEAAVSGDYDSIMITELDLDSPGPKIVYVNDGFCKMTGYAKEEVIGKTPRLLQGPKTDREVLDQLKRQLTEGQSFFGQAVNYKKDGSEFVNQWDIHPLTDAGGNITHWVSYQHDITKRKRAEKVLMDTQLEFDELREASSRTLLDVDFEGNIIMANKSFRHLTGFGKDELREKKVWDLFPQKYRDSLKSRFGDEKEGENFSNQKFRGIIRHQTGIPIQVEGKTRIIELNDQILIRAEIVNVSLQKRVLETLQRRNRDYNMIVEKASEFTYRLVLSNGKYRFEFFSDEFSEVTGISPENVMMQEGVAAFVHEEDIPKVEDHFQKVCTEKTCTCEYRIRNKNGTYVNIIDYGSLYRQDADTDRICIQGAVSLKPGQRVTRDSQSIH
jgi:PAS domain S-box-containing protein